MHIISPCVRSKRAHKQERHVLPTFFTFQGSHGDARESLRRSEPNNFLVTLEPLSGHFGHLRVPLGHLMITLGSLWSYFGCNRVDFEKHSFSQIDFNDFIKLWGCFGIALTSFWDKFWHMRVTLEALRGHLGVTLSI